MQIQQGEGRNPRSRNRKIFWIKLVFSFRGKYFRSRNPRTIWSKYRGKVNVPQILSKFSQNFQIFLQFSSAQNFQPRFLNFPCQMENIPQIDFLEFFRKFPKSIICKFCKDFHTYSRSSFGSRKILFKFLINFYSR